ncbi:hypothetical protein CPT_Machias_284 [Staphylococcus phage Machias]|nr:hypothetical protein CPT_Machias_284 [Staphylococcus phage Machias]
MNKRNQKKLEKRLGLKLNESQKKELLSRKDLERVDFEFVTLPETEEDKEQKFDVKIKSDSNFLLNLKIKFFRKVLNLTIKRKETKEDINENE